MPPRVHLVRHAQGHHNISPEGHALLDPQLTAAGKDQARRLQQDFPFYGSISLILASPIKRALYTALIGFDEQIRRRGLKVVAMPDLQPTSDRLCDTGVSRHEVAREFEGKPVDLSWVTPGWECKRGRWKTTEEATMKRAREVVEWVAGRGEEEIVIVSHRESLIAQEPRKANDADLMEVV
jgi:broad specificity phosphatase PhoE